MEVTMLGTGAPLAPGRATTGLLVTAPDCEPLLLDTCGGFELARQLVAAGVTLADLRNVIVTHRHLDHSGGVPALLLANLPLAFYGSEDTQAGLDGLRGRDLPGVAAAVRRDAPGRRRRANGARSAASPWNSSRSSIASPTLAVRVSHGGKVVGVQRRQRAVRCPDRLCARRRPLRLRRDLRRA